MGINMKAPIIVFAYNRKDHLERTINALAANEGAGASDLFVFVDAPKQGAADERNEAVRSFLTEYKQAHEKDGTFNSITLTMAAEHKGLANSVISGVSLVIEKYKCAIVVEDDIVTSPYFLNYMNDALEYYKDDKKVWSISGYTLPLKSLQNYSDDVYAFYRCCSWGWATWEDRWKLNDWEVKDFADFDRNFFKRRKFNRGGRDLSFQLDRQMLGWIDSWAIRWGYNEYKNDMVTIYPAASYVDNEGFDGTGTHFGTVSTNYDTKIQGKKEYRFVKPVTDRAVAKEFQARYSEKWIKAMIKEVLYCLHLYKVK
ncbi:MAG: glycosyl transferase [Bacteroides sp.]